MNNIMIKTYELIDELDKSDIIKNIVYYKDKINNNEDIQQLIHKGNNCDNEYLIRDIKSKLYNYDDYKKYMDSYNKIMYIVMDINSRFKKLTNDKICFR